MKTKEKLKIFINTYPDKEGNIHTAWDIKGKSNINQLAAMFFMMERSIDAMKKDIFEGHKNGVNNKDL